MSKYQGFAIALIGTNGTGKSTWMKSVMDQYKRNVLLLMDDDSEEMFDYLTEVNKEQIGLFTGQAVHYVDSMTRSSRAESFNAIYESFGRVGDTQHGGLMCVDDAMAILDVRDPAMMKIFKKRRQRKMDIIMNCHGAEEYPVSLFRNTTHFVIFQTVGSIQNIINGGRMNSEAAKIFEQMVNHVNEVAKTNRHYFVEFELRDPEKSLQKLRR